ncbi:nicotinate phosphoribosyltransferase [Geopsychrobacter electrodiphilus]|uniref:nicotinate phosphoribosyltransferase n=1 Tax=Geopsychrobacter electrodiphilus TaxID=225196 RepID=UPI00035DFC2D|nr:nicotinate phosphoribosyltransferase [Geopsychrobacter electrodiphilus]
MISALLTDLYQLTMLAGYHARGMHRDHAVFDLYFRTPPYHGSYAIFAGLQPALVYLENLKFEPAEIDYLGNLGLFKPDFLTWLADFRFRGQVTAPPEGTAVFPHTPLLTLEGSLAEVQFVETALLNIINFQTLVATKAARLCLAAGAAKVIDFGLRRAQGPDGAMSVARAAAVGGGNETSNLLAGQRFGLAVRGTQAHSWVMAFDSELEAFRAYAESFPATCVLLVDTWDTLKSGVPNAVTVARELREKGFELAGIRLDSGDLAWLSRQARQMLDEAGFPQVKILASNELDEELIEAIRGDGGRIDIYGVGTRLATCAGEGGGALGGVYKLVEIAGRPTLKATGDPAKATLPGAKVVYRVEDEDGQYLLDLIALQGESILPEAEVFDPENPVRSLKIPARARLKEFHQLVMSGGELLGVEEGLADMTKRSQRELACLPAGSLRLRNPHRYKVSISRGLLELRQRLLAEAAIQAGRST